MTMGVTKAVEFYSYAGSICQSRVIAHGNCEVGADLTVTAYGLPALRNIFEDFLRTCHTIIAMIQHPSSRQSLSAEFHRLEGHARQTVVESYFS